MIVSRTGAWSTPSNWEVADNIGFVGAIPASVAPNNINSAGIFIRNGSPITVGSTVTADNLTIDASAVLTVGAGGNFTLANGTGTDLTIDGNFNVNNTTTTAGWKQHCIKWHLDYHSRFRSFNCKWHYGGGWNRCLY